MILGCNFKYLSQLFLHINILVSIISDYCAHFYLKLLILKYVPTILLCNAIYLYNYIKMFATIEHFMLINYYIYTFSIACLS